MKPQTKTQGWSATLLRETLKGYYPKTYRKLLAERKLEPLLYKNQNNYMEAVRVSVLEGTDEMSAWVLHRKILMELPYNLDRGENEPQPLPPPNVLMSDDLSIGAQDTRIYYSESNR